MCVCACGKDGVAYGSVSGASCNMGFCGKGVKITLTGLLVCVWEGE